jgi:hypothetical protein
MLGIPVLGSQARKTDSPGAKTERFYRKAPKGFTIET